MMSDNSNPQRQKGMSWDNKGQFHHSHQTIGFGEVEHPLHFFRREPEDSPHGPPSRIQVFGQCSSNLRSSCLRPTRLGQDAQQRSSLIPNFHYSNSNFCGLDPGNILSDIFAHKDHNSSRSRIFCYDILVALFPSCNAHGTTKGMEVRI
ncbi:hypothetical protein I7I50_00489 [Histoplasma capsulatum G186AR]|uniref:Uncharacterized protein n=1 Tax=Ajellomyces capsulatus TaxID=5037 RepID=A0A8H7YGF4_AJECA|nr:hypothetical protein I7I52_07757 [Histoplasma capsulatum]QSS72594.1 hypothetical protein I7I50_00489 [Histoplasma capsulatum G186AR]